MGTAAREAAQIVDALPPEKAQAVIAFARFLAEQTDEDEWNSRLSSAKHAAKLKARLSEVDRAIAAGKAEPLDTKRL
jgi:hypothetical protein